jgi:hypothetical protein
MATLEEITYDASRSALADQESVAAGIRQRTGTLLAAHALVASFLGAGRRSGERQLCPPASGLDHAPCCPRNAGASRAAGGMPVRQRRQVSVGRPEPARVWLLDASSGNVARQLVCPKSGSLAETAAWRREVTPVAPALRPTAPTSVLKAGRYGDAGEPAWLGTG